MFTKKISVITFIALLSTLLSINSYANGFAIAKKNLEAKLVLEGYSNDQIKKRVKINTPKANKLREYLKSSCLFYNKTQRYNSGGFYGSTQNSEAISFRADGTLSIKENSSGFAGGSGYSDVNRGNGGTTTIGYWNVAQGLAGQAVIIFSYDKIRTGLFIVTDYNNGKLGMMAFNASEAIIYNRIANSRC